MIDSELNYFVDLQTYPIDRLGSEAGQDLLNRAHRMMKEDTLVEYPDFLRSQAVVALANRTNDRLFLVGLFIIFLQKKPASACTETGPSFVLALFILRPQAVKSAQKNVSWFNFWMCADLVTFRRYFTAIIDPEKEICQSLQGRQMQDS